MNKSKILQYKGRVDLAQYASRGCPKFARKEIKHYVPKMKRSSDWDAIIEMVNSINIEDDGHTAELVRALV